MDMQKYIDMAKTQGFDTVAQLDVSSLEFLPEVRDMCAADKCHSFNKSWSCPPACGSIEEISQKCRQYTHGIIVQTICRREDEYDFMYMIESHDTHKERFAALAEAYFAEGADCYPMGTGACTICENCTFPDSPCRFPEKMHSSMEANGLFVSKVCKDNGVEYYYGEGTICYVSCFLFK